MSEEVKWIKITTSMFDDEKIRVIHDLPEGAELILIWVKLLCMAGRTNSNGYIFITENIPYTENTLASVLHASLNIVKLALNTFRSMGMLSMDEKGIFINNFSFYQNTAGLEIIRAHEAEKKRLYRAKAKSPLLLNDQDKSTDNVQDKSTDSSLKKESKSKDIYSLQDNPVSSDFSSFKNQLGNGSNKVAVLVMAFKAWHPAAPSEDFDTCGNRIAGMLKQCSNDYGFLLEKIYQAGSKSISGSHLNYINGCLKVKPTAQGGAKPVNYQELK